MQQPISLKVLPQEADDQAAIINLIAKTAGKKITSITGFTTLKKSIDARGKIIWVNLLVNAFIDEPYQHRRLLSFQFKDVHIAAKKIIIVGAGPAGLFAALQLIELGIQPIILERGKDVRARRRDLAALNKGGIVNPESNYCFGEGGAGTYSDGKLYTRSSKRGDIDRILNLFVHFGAEEKILYEAHPHIGTNKLPVIISAMRETIEACGGQLLFHKKVTDFVVAEDTITSVTCADGDRITADAVILATGHSARDIFELLHRKKILIEAKPFALGVRVEHRQQLIDGIQYSCLYDRTTHAVAERPASLPPSSYSLVQQVNGRGVFSFCMCPGGIIAPAATAPGELVVNGWSPSKRNNPYANSGMVVSVDEKDAYRTLKNLQGFKGFEYLENLDRNSPLLMMQFQQLVEQQCFKAGGSNMAAPAQRLIDFCDRRLSDSLPQCSYQPGLQSSLLHEVLPDFIYQALAGGFEAFGKKMKGYFTNDAVVVATESRTSSPVRIPRNNDTLAHPQIKNLFPCGEGAGYAGGIVSAAMDGERVAKGVAVLVGK